MLGFFFKQYDGIADRYVIFDSGSTDGSLDILHSHPKVEVRPFPPRIDDSYVLTAQHLHNTVWKQSRDRADWAIITAIDEHLMHPCLHTYLQRGLNAGVTMLPALGYQMISDVFPGSDAMLTKTITTGAPFAKMSKLCIFQPNAIRETRFGVGRHDASPEGQICIPQQDEVLNLHFKYLDFDRLHARHQFLAGGLGGLDQKRNWGHRYLYDKDRLRDDWNAFADLAIDLRDAVPNAAAVHNENRWWRSAENSYAEIKL